ncbi:MAG: Sec-independent protein translocase subunit TatB [Burkholderiales bacterium]|nr:Sec-independent protein translocase subunit TatB [Burkholderiales bacterium]
MIDLGLTKIALIGVVALIVIGPEKLPKVARTLGTLYGRAQRYISQVKSEVSREMEMEELRAMHKEVQEAAQDVGNSIASHLNQTGQMIESAWQDPPAPSTYWTPTPTNEQIAARAKTFKRRKLQRTSNVPGWYKQRNKVKMHVMSGAARVALHRPRPQGKAPASFYG